MIDIVRYAQLKDKKTLKATPASPYQSVELLCEINATKRAVLKA